MDAMTAFLASMDTSNAILAAVNEKLVLGGVSITRKEAALLAEQRSELLAEVERLEFGTPALIVIAEAVAMSPCLAQDNVADTLAKLQKAFYALRDELPIDVPDTEIADALRGCLDACGDAAEVAALPTEEVMAFSDAYVQTREAEDSTYQITDDEGRVYTFDPTAWDYDEQAAGWDGERWSDDWGD